MLTALRVAKFAAIGKHKDGGGLYLQVTSGKAGIAKSWLLRFTSPETRKGRWQGLGRFPQVSLREAREARDKALALVRSGIDPIEERKRQRAGASTLRTYASPVFGSLPVAAISTEHVLAALKPVWLTKPATASRARQRIERVLAFARVRGYCQGENPARWRDHLDQLLPKPSKVRAQGHHAATDYRDLPEFMAQLLGRSESHNP